MRFGFGKNWVSYIEKHFNEEKVSIPQKHIAKFIKRENLNGLTFLDVGCGSGLHSLAAWRMGAKKIVSFDYDPYSVHATKKLHAYVGKPNNWEIFEGSILDVSFVHSLGQFDFVYSWGVLHHTGEMWNALENTIHAIKEDGTLYIALYSKDVYIDPPYTRLC